MFYFMYEKVVSPNPSLIDVLSLSPEIEMEDGWSWLTLLSMIGFLLRIPTNVMLRRSLLLLRT